MAQVRSLTASLDTIQTGAIETQVNLNSVSAKVTDTAASINTLDASLQKAAVSFGTFSAAARRGQYDVDFGRLFGDDAHLTPLAMATAMERDFLATQGVATLQFGNLKERVKAGMGTLSSTLIGQTESLGQQLRRAALGFSRILTPTGLLGQGGAIASGLGSQISMLAGLPLALTAAVGAAAVGIGIIGYAFKEALAVDPEAQRQLSELGRSIKNLAAQIGEPLLDSVQRILTPLAKVVDRLADLVDLMNNFKPPRWLEFLGNMGAGATGIAIELLQLLDQFGLLGEASAAGDKPAGQQRGGAFVALEQFTKNLQSDANQKDDARKAREALEEIARNGVRIKNPQAGPQFAPAMA